MRLDVAASERPEAVHCLWWDTDVARQFGAAVGVEGADRLNELQIPCEIIFTSKMRHEFLQWQKGRRLMIVLDLPDGRILTGFKKLKTKITK